MGQREGVAGFPLVGDEWESPYTHNECNCKVQVR
ncbi:hypothetical protein SAMN04487948_13228 [Halogranum amylolyticum]|uniref:Uncharacterized protein n=1 Tax=Halogranum amylolyticum TaxID=660520 RepID=A0A1H8WKF7_9EURY|nr:hypothetical protein SAMN04487948_13228 [Halogranum amylolyticum]